MRSVKGKRDTGTIKRRKAKDALREVELAGMTPAEAEDWVETNVTAATSVKAALKVLTVAVASLATCVIGDE